MNSASYDNQKVKADLGKPRLTLVPSEIIYNIAAVREYGWWKYGEQADHWTDAGAARYKDAAYRHWLEYLNDPASVDEESGLPHLWHLACNIAFLCELERENFNAPEGSHEG